jgi:transglutaminase-like putative cysteine protease
MVLLNRRQADWYAANDRHEFKVADLKDRLVPTPALTARFCISRVDRPEYYDWDYDGVIGLAGRSKTPPGVVVHSDCRTLDPSALPPDAFAAKIIAANYATIPPELAPAIGEIARDWAGEIPFGWPQIEALVSRLRDGFVVDASAVAPAEHPAPVLWFLTESKRGPDYLFATAAALLLRSLDYPTRVCLGYYASPDAYDADSQHTPVRSTDLHVWPEILLRDGHWLVVEPTPGYSVLPPKRSWRERALAGIADFGAWAGRNAVALGIAISLFAILIWRRRSVVDAAFTLAWRLAPGRSWQRAALNTARLLERRGRLAGRPRSQQRTLREWTGGLDGDDMGEFLRLAEWAAYAPAFAPPVPAQDVWATCRRVVAHWSRRRLRASMELGGSV